MILYTPGQRVKYDNKLWNIEKMTEKDGQTVVRLRHGFYRKEVNVEDLEAKAVREILFRGKRVDNGEWVYGYYVFACFGRFPCRPAIVPELNGTWRPIEVISETVGEFTGLTDKNGRKIFEGDILKVYEEFPFFDGYNSKDICYNGKVMYIDNQGMYVCEGNENGNAFCALNLDECEVIGNIHDNPELMGAHNEKI